MKWIFRSACVSVLFVGACAMFLASDAATASSAIVASAPDDDIVPVEESMHEFMEYVFQPTWMRLKQNMMAAPADNKGWKAIKSDSLILAESCNLLLGRKPAENGQDWVKHAVASKEHGAALYAAAKTKNFETASTAYRSMLDNCNACHKQFENGKHILQP